MKNPELLPHQVYALKGIIKQESDFFRAGAIVWFIGFDKKDKNGFMTFFITGKNKRGKNDIVKVIANKPDLIDFNWVRVDLNFANDHKIYRLTQKQMDDKIENTQRELLKKKNFGNTVRL